MEGWDADAVESVGKVVDVNLHERRSVLVLCSELLENGPNLSARTAPRRREVNDQQRLRSKKRSRVPERRQLVKKVRHLRC